MEFLGFGVDLVSVVRVERLIANNPRTLSKLLNSDEMDGNPQRIAGRIACKEAIMKAIPNFSRANLKQLTISNDQSGAPIVKSNGALLQNEQVKLSISHDGDYAIALAIVLRVD
jgi:holo-[acyl-carrier-protein] synthase